MKHKITFLLHSKFESLDLSGPCSAFNLVNELYDSRYDIAVVSAAGGSITDRAGLSVNTEKFRTSPKTKQFWSLGGRPRIFTNWIPKPRNYSPNTLIIQFVWRVFVLEHSF